MTEVGDGVAGTWAGGRRESPGERTEGKRARGVDAAEAPALAMPLATLNGAAGCAA